MAKNKAVKIALSSSYGMLRNKKSELCQSVINDLIKCYEDLQAEELDENLSRRYYSILMSLYDIKEDLTDGKLF